MNQNPCSVYMNKLVRNMVLKVLDSFIRQDNKKEAVTKEYVNNFLTNSLYYYYIVV